MREKESHRATTSFDSPRATMPCFQAMITGLLNPTKVPCELRSASMLLALVLQAEYEVVSGSKRKHE